MDPGPAKFASRLLAIEAKILTTNLFLPNEPALTPRNMAPSLIVLDKLGAHPAL